jgi:hypothetical protein
MPPKWRPLAVDMAPRTLKILSLAAQMGLLSYYERFSNFLLFWGVFFSPHFLTHLEDVHARILEGKVGMSRAS